MSTPKLPKDVIMMIEKNNTVMAIKTLASDRGISMDDAKTMIDAYEEELIANRNKKLAKIAKKQGINQKPKNNVHNHTINSHDVSNSLNDSVSNHLNDIGYKKPVIPYWVKRVAVVLLVMAIISYMLWQLLG